MAVRALATCMCRLSTTLRPPLFAAAPARFLSKVTLLPHEERTLKAIKAGRAGIPLNYVAGSPFGGEVIVKRVDRFGRRRVRGRRGMSKRVVWLKRVIKDTYRNLTTDYLKRQVRIACRAEVGFKQAIMFQLESRLDMFLRRCMFAPSLEAAKQFISHGFILVNGKAARSAGFQLQYGDVVQVADRGVHTVHRQMLMVRARVAPGRERKVTSPPPLIPTQHPGEAHPHPSSEMAGAAQVPRRAQVRAAGGMGAALSSHLGEA